ncbi:hypothetical protein Zmor_023406 [Zophobas morio]|uniref:Uncharacterized protein n=1 Tax=Zophobas morio TaxID=2755281 RepID=A0AA38M7B6_9CUCU|nr:hypothetical protein Zmor_023406 [Zophobas morio]
MSIFCSFPPYSSLQQVRLRTRSDLDHHNTAKRRERNVAVFAVGKVRFVAPQRTVNAVRGAGTSTILPRESLRASYADFVTAHTPITDVVTDTVINTADSEMVNTRRTIGTRPCRFSARVRRWGDLWVRRFAFAPN